MTKTDILLVNPPSIAFQNIPEPLGILYIASYLLREGFAVKVLDMAVNKLDDEAFSEYVKNVMPRFVGISCYTVHVNEAKKLSNLVKQTVPSSKVIIGGPHPTAMPQKSLEELPAVDIVVFGEGEQTALEIVQGRELSTIKGICYRNEGKICTNSARPLIDNLDSIPSPARHLLPRSDKYSLSFSWEGRTPAAAMLSSRGCPNDCIYCATKVMWTRKVRFRSAENVLKEIDFLVKQGVKEILFYDDNFLLNKKRVKDICDGIAGRGYNLTWCCLSRVDTIDKEVGALIKKAGCHIISFGVESGSQKILDAMNKRVKVEQIYNAFKICKEMGITTKASIIFGAPGENLETIGETKKVLKDVLPDYLWIFIMTPLPGTKLYSLHESAGISSDEWQNFDQISYTKFYECELSYEDLRREVDKAYKEYYFNPSYIASQIKHMNTRKLRAFLTLGKDFLYAIRYVKAGRTKHG